MSTELVLTYNQLTRYALDVVLLLFLLNNILNIFPNPLPTLKKRRKRKKTNLKKAYKKNKAILKYALIAIILINVVIPKGIGSFYPRAKYFPQYVEAQKLRLYYRVFSLLPLTTPNDQAIQKQITTVAAEYSMHPALIRAIVMTESSGNQFALSPTGGCGLMQVMPNTYFSLQGGNPFSTKSNLRAGTKYLRKLYRRFDGNLDLVIAAYNAGPNAVSRHGGIPPYGETRRYVVKVKKLYAQYKNG